MTETAQPGITSARLAGWLLPPLVAFAAVSLEAYLSRLWGSHEALLPLVTLVLLAGMVHAELRQFLVVTFCFIVSFLALRDSILSLHMPLPPGLRYDFVDTLRPVALWFVAILAALAGAAETLRLGGLWARRCYFIAAAIYFTEMGILSFAWSHNAGSVFLMVTGVAALAGAVFAHKLADVSQPEEPDSLPPQQDVRLEALEAARHAAVRSKEWRDTGLGEKEDPEVAGCVGHRPPAALQ